MNKYRGLGLALILLGLAGGLFGSYLLYDLYTFQARTGKSPEMGWLLAIVYVPMGSFLPSSILVYIGSIIRKRFRLFCYLAWFSGLVFSYTFFRHDFWEPFFLILNVVLAVMQFVYVRLAYACLKSPT
jgi:hypothetical protein